MDFDPIKLEALLDLLSQSGVEEFEGYGFHVRFTSSMFTPDRMVKDAPAPEVVMDERADPKSIWEDRRLWPQGKPPEFPSK